MSNHLAASEESAGAVRKASEAVMAAARTLQTCSVFSMTL